MVSLDKTCRTAPIAIYDSGVGGLSITKRLKELLPNESVHYIADTKYLPYGNKTTTELCGYVERVVQFCLDRAYKLLIIACNTATAATTPFLSSYLREASKNIYIINVIDPVVNYVKVKLYRRIALIGTKYTVASGIYEQQFQKTNTTLFSVAAPLLTPMVESLFCGKKVDKMVLKNYLAQLPFQDIDALVLGCTHYLFLEKEIKNILQVHYQKETEIIDVALLTVLAVKQFLTTNRLLNDMEQKGSDCFMATELTPSFRKASEQLFGEAALGIDLETYTKPISIWG